MTSIFSQIPAEGFVDFRRLLQLYVISFCYGNDPMVTTFTVRKFTKARGVVWDPPKIYTQVKYENERKLESLR